MVSSSDKLCRISEEAVNWGRNYLPDLFFQHAIDSVFRESLWLQPCSDQHILVRRNKITTNLAISLSVIILAYPNVCIAPLPGCVIIQFPYHVGKILQFLVLLIPLW
jgi:hypothetical protein